MAFIWLADVISSLLCIISFKYSIVVVLDD